MLILSRPPIIDCGSSEKSKIPEKVNFSSWIFSFKLKGPDNKAHIQSVGLVVENITVLHLQIYVLHD